MTSRVTRFPFGFERALAVGLASALLLAPLAEAGKRKAKNLYTEARKAELQKDYDRALELVEQARIEYPKDHRYELSARRLRFVAAQSHVDSGRRLRDAGQLEEALLEFQRGVEIDPSLTVAAQQLRRTLDLIRKRNGGGEEEAEEDEALSAVELDRVRRTQMIDSLREPPVLEPLSDQPIDIMMSEDSKVVLETIGKLAGVNVIFDPEFSGTEIDISIQNATLSEALDYVGLQAKTFWKAISHNAIFITDDNTNKRRDYEEEVVKTIYLNNVATPQELQEITTAIRGLTDIRRMFPVSSMNALVIRATESKLALAEKVIHDIDKARPEVIIDVLVLEVSTTLSRELGISPVSGGANGINLPVAFARGGDGGSIPLSELNTVRGSDFSTTLPGAQLTALFSSSDTNLLQSPRIRVSDNQQATLRIGDRIPIATGSFQPGIGGVGINPLVNTQFTFTDVGVNIDIQPKVHNDREISMHVQIEISNVRDFVDIGGIQQPIIGQRTIEHDIRLEEGEASILGGLNQSQLFKTKSGVPFLGELPLIGKLFSISKVDRNENEILIALIPHIVRLPTIEQSNLKSIASGTDQVFRVRRVQEKNGKPALPTAVVEPRDEPDEPATVATPEPEPEPAAQPAAAADPEPATTAPEPEPDAPAAEPAAPATAPAAGPRIVFAPADPTVAPGDVFTIDVAIENVSQLFGIPMRIGYDREVLQLNEVEKGDFLAGEEGTDLIFSRNIRNQVGQAAVNISRFPGTGGADGAGTLIRLTFEALAAGESAVRVIPAGARVATSRQPLQIPAARTNVTVR